MWMFLNNNDDDDGLSGDQLAYLGGILLVLGFLCFLIWIVN